MNLFKKFIMVMRGIKLPSEKYIDVSLKNSHTIDVLESKVWYLGEKDGLIDFYKKINRGDNSFWSTCTDDIDMKLCNTGLIKVVIDKLTDIVMSDMMAVKVNAGEYDELYSDIANLMEYDKIYKQGVKDALITGDGAFKISMDNSISPYPILEFYDALNVRYEYKYGILEKIIFIDTFTENGVEYTLEQEYGFGYIRSYLYRGQSTNLIPLSSTEYTSNIMDIDLEDIGLDSNTRLAFKLSYTDSIKFKGRGTPLFYGKFDIADSLDEIISIMNDVTRDSKPIKTIGEDAIPKTADGRLIRPNRANRLFIRTTGDEEGEKDSAPKVTQASIDYTGYLESYMTNLDLLLQGIISPSTLGIDTKKLDNAEAQREKEKATLYTRDNIINSLTPVLKNCIECLLQVNDCLNSNSVGLYDVEVGFGQYANPSFEAQVETISKGVSEGVLSFKTAVDELHPDWSIERKEEEIVYLENMFKAKNSSVSDIQSNETDNLNNETDKNLHI